MSGSKDDDLNAAAFIDDPQDVAQLLADGANPDARNDHGQTALMAAASGGSVESAKILLAHGVDVKAKDLFGMTALDLAQEAFERAHNAGASSAADHETMVEILTDAMDSAG